MECHDSLEQEVDVRAATERRLYNDVTLNRKYLRITHAVRFFDYGPPYTVGARYKKEPAGEPTVLTKRGEDSEWTKQTNNSKWNVRPGRQRQIKCPGRDPENEKGSDPAAAADYQ
jgi:hypothetical protein